MPGSLGTPTWSFAMNRVWKIGERASRFKRGYITLRIPQEVAERVHRRLSAGALANPFTMIILAQYGLCSIPSALHSERGLSRSGAYGRRCRPENAAPRAGRSHRRERL